MSRKPRLPDAWDDDYEAVADAQVAAQEPAAPQKLSRAERKAKHAEANRALWQSAENPETFHFIEMQKANVPLKSEYKPAVRVLSRKPQAPTVLAKPGGGPGQAEAGLGGGLAGLTLQDEEDDSEEEERKAEAEKLKKRQEQARIEREEKQRKYAEARERIFGTTSSPALSEDEKRERQSPMARGNASAPRARGRGRGSRTQNNNLGREAAQSGSSGNTSPARPQMATKQLFDPNYSERPASMGFSKRDEAQGQDVEKPIRQPKGPDYSRGGFGFALRGKQPAAPPD